MTFIPRHPTTQDVMCSHDALTGTAAAGSVVYLSGDLKVAKCSASGNVPFGFLGLPVRAANAGQPEGYQFPGQLGATEALLGDPVLVFMGGGQFSTTNYVLPTGVLAGTYLYALIGDPANDGKLTSVAASGAFDADSTRKKVAVTENSISTANATAGVALVVKILL